MRTLIYTVKIEISEKADYEAATSTFEAYIESYNTASEEEFGEGEVVAEITAVN